MAMETTETTMQRIHKRRTLRGGSRVQSTTNVWVSHSRQGLGALRAYLPNKCMHAHDVPKGTFYAFRLDALLYAWGRLWWSERVPRATRSDQNEWDFQDRRHGYLGLLVIVRRERCGAQNDGVQRYRDKTKRTPRCTRKRVFSTVGLTRGAMFARPEPSNLYAYFSERRRYRRTVSLLGDVR